MNSTRRRRQFPPSCKGMTVEPYPPPSLASGHNTSSPPMRCCPECVCGGGGPTMHAAHCNTCAQIAVRCGAPPLVGVRLVPIGPYPVSCMLCRACQCQVVLLGSFVLCVQRAVPCHRVLSGQVFVGSDAGPRNFFPSLPSSQFRTAVHTETREQYRIGPQSGESTRVTWHRFLANLGPRTRFCAFQAAPYLIDRAHRPAAVFLNNTAAQILSPTLQPAWAAWGRPTAAGGCGTRSLMPF